MSTLLTIKLFCPAPRPDAVERPRLLDQLHAGLSGRLTLISAPAGYGKTTLLGTWAAASDRPVAWLALDSADADPARFVTYLVAALQTVAPSIGGTLLTALVGPQPPPPTAAMTALLNALAHHTTPLVLVLDDYHLLDAPPVDALLADLLRYAPPTLHLVIATRHVPNLPLAQLRARGLLNELRATDLRFDAHEAAVFLAHTMRLCLTPDAVTALEARTEGWAAGLQLAALALRNAPDAERVAAAFSGSHPYVLDYLLEDVLQQQPTDIQRFLRQTAPLSRLCAPLCAALLDEPAATCQTLLERCAASSLFLVPLDSDQRWFRYHHLFAEALRRYTERQLAEPSPAALHARASDWYAAHGLALDAFEHAVASDDLDRAERCAHALRFSGALEPVIRWLATLPPALLDARPALSVLYASALTITGRPASRIIPLLHTAEAALHRNATTHTTATNTHGDLHGHVARVDQADALPTPTSTHGDLHGQIAGIRAMLAIPHAHTDVLLEQSRLALAYLDATNLPLRATATWTLGLGHQLSGDAQAARKAYTDALTLSRAANSLLVTIAALTCLGQLAEAASETAHAIDCYQQVLVHAGDPPLPAACEAYLGLARIQVGQQNLTDAETHVQRATALAQQIENVDTLVGCWLLLAKIRTVQGEYATAATLLTRAEAFAQQHGYTQHGPAIAHARAALPAQTPTPAMHLDALTPRELAILRLVAEGLSNQEIGARLFLALDTVKGYNRRMYDKLQVQRRTEAVARARELGLL